MISVDTPYTDFIYKKQIHIWSYQAKKGTWKSFSKCLHFTVNKTEPRKNLAQNHPAGLQQSKDQKPASHPQIVCMVVYKDSAVGDGYFHYSCFFLFVYRSVYCIKF